MAAKIRLSRGGAKKRPYYYVVIAHSASPRDGRYIEQVGTFDPMLKKDNPDRVKLNLDRCKHWLSVGAQPTDRVARLLDAAGLMKREARNNPEKMKPKKTIMKVIIRICCCICGSVGLGCIFCWRMVSTT